MNGWSKEDLEEMFGDDIIEQLAFVSGCHQHQLCNGNPSGWIIPEESLRKFAELIVRECARRCEDIAIKHQVEETTYAAGKKAGAFECAKDLKQHFGVEE